jgi:anti-anti-sigma factor
MKIAHEDKDGVACITIDGRLDADSAPQAEQAVKDLIRAGSHRLVFDFSRMDYISSAGLRVILMTVKELRAKEGKVVLCGLTPYVKEVFDVSNFASIVPIADSVEAGLQLVR